MKPNSILIVEDDTDINNLLAKICVKSGYAVEQAFSGTEAQLRLEKAKPDLILLDLMIPGKTGEELILYIRNEMNLDIPIIVISAKVQLESKVEALALGADDYMVKPFETAEVVARIQAALRRYKNTSSTNTDATSENEIYTFRNLSINVPKRQAKLKGKEVILTGHEFDILHTLIKAPDTVFSRERLYELVWKSGYYGEDNTVNVHVSNIRKKLSAIAPDDEYIKNVWGIGFKLV